MSKNLYHGDCLEILKSVNSNTIDLLLTDLPYGTTQNKWDTIIDFKLMWKELNRVVKKNGAMAFTCQQPFTTKLINSNIKNFKYCWIWVKDNATGFLNAKKYPMKIHEDIAIFCNGLHVYNPQMKLGIKYNSLQGKKTDNYGKYNKTLTINNGERYPVTTLYFKRDQNKIHPTQKPIRLMEYLIKTYTNEKETVLDICMGSGSTGVAAKLCNRNFVGIEINKEYFDIAKERIEAEGELKQKINDNEFQESFWE